MKKSRIALLVTIFMSLIFSGVLTTDAADLSRGEEAFVKHCAGCHAGGGNIVDADKPLNMKALRANGIKTPADIIRLMRNPEPGMTRFDEKTIDRPTAEDIAAYILKTFK